MTLSLGRPCDATQRNVVFYPRFCIRLLEAETFAWATRSYLGRMRNRISRDSFLFQVVGPRKSESYSTGRTQKIHMFAEADDQARRSSAITVALVDAAYILTDSAISSIQNFL
jgi:hypothetical protein